MAKGTRGRRRLASRKYRSTPYPLPLCGQQDVEKEVNQKKASKALEKKDWEDATCSVCMEYPHNAVLLLCSSHDKGCRPYMCGTSYRYSNCLNQFKKAYTKVMSPPSEQGQVQDSLWQGSRENQGFGLNLALPNEKCEVSELACPLCRGQVKGWTVVEAAREYLNAKKRNCMQDDCSFVGTYKELRKHVRAEHPCARPREVDPVLEEKWSRLERERERNDVMSTIRSSMPGALVLGDYVIERGNNGYDSNEEGRAHEDRDYDVDMDDGNWLNVLFLLQAFGRGASFSSRLRRTRGGVSHSAAARATRAAVAFSSEEEDGAPASRGRRVVGIGRSDRRRRRSRRDR